MSAPKTYVWQHENWPNLTFDHERVSAAIALARRIQGELEGKAHAIGLSESGNVAVAVMEQEATATAAIEGERLDPAAVRSSVRRHLGLTDSGPLDRHVEGLVDLITDAGTAYEVPLDHDRLHRWQAALFPGGLSGITRIAVGRYRDHADPMQIVSGPVGKEKVHYEAPPSARVEQEMQCFLDWFAETAPQPGIPVALDGFARASIAHLWFEIIHPFEDGNGRIGRAIVEMALAQDQRNPLRLYSLSRQLMESRSGYYEAVNAASRGTGDVTNWVNWFVRQIGAACTWSIHAIDTALNKNRFWTAHATTDLKPRQRKVLQRLLDDGDGGFVGGLNADKYMKMTSVSKATATRDLAELLSADVLWSQGQGKGVRYYVNFPGWTHGVTHPASEAT